MLPKYPILDVQDAKFIKDSTMLSLAYKVILEVRFKNFYLFTEMLKFSQQDTVWVQL
jgi:hypothetical protein